MFFGPPEFRDVSSSVDAPTGKGHFLSFLGPYEIVVLLPIFPEILVFLFLVIGVIGHLSSNPPEVYKWVLADLFSKGQRKRQKIRGDCV